MQWFLLRESEQILGKQSQEAIINMPNGNSENLQTTPQHKAVSEESVVTETS